MWEVGFPRLGGGSLHVGRWRAATLTPSPGMSNPSEKEMARVWLFLVRLPIWEWTNEASASLFDAIRARILGRDGVSWKSSREMI